MNRGEMTAERFQSGQNYVESSNLAARQGLHDYKRPDYDMPGLVSARVSGSPKRILDVGCGNGWYLRRLREDFPEAEVIGIDLSPGMLEGLAEPTLVADVTDLPFESGSADVVLAMHMLYHCPDIGAALDELSRVLAPAGTLFVSTVAEDDKVEYAELWRLAAQEALGIDVGDKRRVVLDHFSLTSAQSMLTDRFNAVRLHDLPGVIELPEPGPLVAFYRSMASFMELEAEEFDLVMARIETRLDDYFATADMLRITSHSGILECRGLRA